MRNQASSPDVRVLTWRRAEGVVVTRVVGRALAALVAAVVVAVVGGLLSGPLAAPAVAAELEVCFLDAQGNVNCPTPEDPDDCERDPEGRLSCRPLYPPPDLLNPGLMQSVDASTYHTLLTTQQQAIQHVLDAHQLPASDRNALLSWGRAEVEAEFVAIVLQAAKTPREQRTADQAILVNWAASLVQQQGQQAAERAGDEFVLWAGLSRSTYRQKLGQSVEELTEFLSGNPEAKADEPVDALDPRESGYCDYQPPAPYTADYDGSYLPQCFGQCPSMTGCAVPWPTYDQFVQWGQVDQLGVAQSRAVQMTLSELAGVAAASGGAGATVGLGGGTAIAGLDVMRGVVHTYQNIQEAYDLVVDAAVIAGYVEKGFEVAEAEHRAWLVAARAVGGLATNLTLFLDAANVVGILTAALYVGVYQFLTLLSSERLPLALATYIKRAQTAFYDPGELVKTEDGTTTLLTLLARQLHPTPQVYPGRETVNEQTGARAPVTSPNCDNSLIPAEAYLGRKDTRVIRNPDDAAELLIVPIVPCLNPTPLPAADPTGPSFLLEPRTPGTAPSTLVTQSIQMANSHGDYISTVRVSGHWFIETVGMGDDAGGITQRLRLNYTDWDDQPQSTYLYGNDQEGYHFVGVALSEDVLIDPATCESAGTCWKSDTIEFTGPDGVDWTARLRPYVPPTGAPKTVTDNPMSAQPVTFDANGFAPGEATGEVLYLWQFQKDGCGVPCLTFDGGASGSEPTPVWDGTASGPRPTHVWRTLGDYQVRVTAIDEAGRKAVTTFTVNVGGVAPKPTWAQLCEGASTTECTNQTSTVGSTATVLADVAHPGSMDNVFATVDWGDGTSTSVQQGPNLQDTNTTSASLTVTNPNLKRLSATHAYTRPGYFVVTVSTRDQGGNTAVSTRHTIAVTGRQIITFGPLADRKYGSGMIVRAEGGGSTRPVTFTAEPIEVCTASGLNGQVITPVGLGTCTVTAGQAGEGIFLAGLPVSRSFQVTPADLVIEADDQQKTYGDPNPEFTTRVTGLRNGDTRDEIVGLKIVPPSEKAAVGDHPIEPRGAVHPNYDIHYVNGTLTVRRAQLTITADDKTRVYGSPRPAYTATFDGLVNGDTADAVTGLKLDGPPQEMGVGEHPIIPRGATSPNYEIHYEHGTETITQAPLTVTVDSITRRYGESPDYSVSYEGLVNGDTDIGLLDFTGAPGGSLADVGTYPLTVTGNNMANYEITMHDGTETVTPAPLEIRAQDKTRLYGAPSPDYTTTFSGLVNGDTRADVTGLVIKGAPASAGVGTYPIELSGATNPNYDITMTHGTETVLTAPLTITADDKTSVYGGPDPDFTATYRGLVNGDEAADIEGLQFVSASPGSDVGVYGIAPNGASNPNYEIDFVAGKHTITPAPLTIEAEPSTTKFGTFATYTWKGVGWVNGDTDATIDTAPECRATIQGAAASVTTAPGAYLGAITCSGGADANYDISHSDAGATLTVNPVIRLAQTGLPATVPALATLDGSVLTLPTGEREVDFGTAHSYSFPSVVTDADGVLHMTRTPGFTGPVAANLEVTASYSTMTGLLATAVSDGGVDQKTAKSLEATWSEAQAAVKTGKLARARVSLKSFATTLRGQSGKKIAEPTADLLLAYAQLAFTHVGGTGTV